MNFLCVSNFIVPPSILTPFLLLGIRVGSNPTILMRGLALSHMFVWLFVSEGERDEATKADHIKRS
nr:MAG TPA: hypothetical protein [Caudoviricetes sp.]